MQTFSIIRNKTQRLLMLAVYSMLLCACIKEKKDNNIGPLDVSIRSQSSIRLFNFYYTPLDVMINNIPLTSFSARPEGGTPLGLSIFPKGKWFTGDNGSPFTVPNSVLDKNGKAYIRLTANNVVVDTVLTHDFTRPTDYYLTIGGKLKAIPRQNTPPVSPDHFRIRIIHLGKSNDPFGLGTPVTLTYADGSTVNPKLSNIAVNSTSDYVEVPYGAYQFKVFATAGGTINVKAQLAELPMVPLYDGCNPGTIPPQQGIFPRVRTFKPGGVYSIVITDNRIDYWDCNKVIKTSFELNVYRIVTELDPGVNHSYARMHAVNALPGKKVKVKVDGRELGGELPYIGTSLPNEPVQARYTTFVQGDHQVEAIDDKGQSLATASIKLYPYDNYTIWVHETPEGKTNLLFSANDMTSTIYASAYRRPDGAVIIDDGTDGVGRLTRYPYAWQSRFINLSPDLPFATFTNDHQLFLPASSPISSDTIRYISAYVNQASGKLPVKNASLIYTLPTFESFAAFDPDFRKETETNLLPGLIRVFSSSPGNPVSIPGTLLIQVPPLNARRAFIINPLLYAEGRMPNAETGIYTVVLTGRTFRTGSPEEKARMIVIKHNN